MSGPQGDNTGVGNFDSVTTDRLSNAGEGATFHVYLDSAGTSVLADEQRRGGEQLEFSSIGTALDTIGVDHLPPAGDGTEGTGLILIKVPGEGETYRSGVGDLSDPTANGVRLLAGMHVKGEVMTHEDPDKQNSTIPTTEDPVLLPFSTKAFVAPNVNSDQLIEPRLTNLGLYGPGSASVGSVGLDDNGPSNSWDWLWVKRCHIFNVLDPVDFSTALSRRSFQNTIIRKFTGTVQFQDRTYFRGGEINIGDTSATLNLNGAFIQDGTNIGVSGDGNEIAVKSGGALYECRIRKPGSTTGTGGPIRVQSGGKIHGCKFVNPSNGSWDKVIRVKGVCTVTDNEDRTDSNASVSIESGAADSYIAGNDFPNGYARLPSNGTRVYLDGRVVVPETISLGGSDGEIIHQVEPKVNPYRILIDAGGSASNLQGIGGVVKTPGQMVIVEHTGGENVVLEHNATGASNPLNNQDGANITLTTNGDWAMYMSTTADGDWMQGRL